MRSKKISTMGSVASSLKHAYREKETINADSDKTNLNIGLTSKSTDEAMGKLRSKLNNLDKPPRSNSVRAVEYVMTTSPEWWETAGSEERADFFNSSHKWLKDTYGEDNVIATVVHMDETTPHVSAFVVPITEDGRLSARDFLGGRDKMKEQQDSFYDAVKHLKLERGAERSRARHNDIKTFYSSVNASKDEMSAMEIKLKYAIPDKKFLEKDGAYKERVIENLQRELKPVIQQASNAKYLARAEQEAKKLAEVTQKRNNALETQKNELKDTYETLKEKAYTLSGAVGKALGRDAVLKIVNDYKLDLEQQSEIAKFQEEQRKKREQEAKATTKIQKRNRKKARGMER